MFDLIFDFLGKERWVVLMARILLKNCVYRKFLMFLMIWYILDYYWSFYSIMYSMYLFKFIFIYFQLPK